MLPLTAALILLASCKKEVAEPNPIDPTNPTEIKANANFNWKTTQTLAVTVTGTPVSTTTVRKFSVQLEDGSSLYAANHNMSENFSFTIAVPAHVNKLIYKFGTISKVVSVTGTQVAMDYLVETNNGYDPNN